MPRRSVVITNIAKDITPNQIVNYLSDELHLDKESIRVTPLVPAGKNLSDFSYMQYRVSVPAVMHSSVLTPSTWPIGVKVRDYIYNKKKDVASLANFLSKRPTGAPTPSVAQESPVILDETTMEQ